MNFNISELVSYDFFFFSGWKNVSLEPSTVSQVLVKIVFDKRITLAMTSDKLIILRFYNCTPITSCFSTRSIRRHQIIYRVLASQVSLRTCLRPVIQIQRQMKSQSHLVAYSITNLLASNLHKNSKVCKVITRTRYFIVDFFDQRASSLRPIPNNVASTIIERKKRKTIQNTY